MLALAGLAADSPAPADPSRYEFAEPHMGTQFVLRFYAPSRMRAKRAADAAFARIAELDSKLSDFQRDSELSRLSRSAGSGDAMEVGDDLWFVLGQAERMSEASEGAFDITVGPFVRLWRRARHTGQLPSEKRLKEARAAVGHGSVVREDGQRVRLTREDMRLDLGGIAKGYAADQALEALRRHGVTRALVDAGGDLALGDPPPGEEGWRVGVAPLRPQKPPKEQQNSSGGDPRSDREILTLKDCGVATSGDAYQFVEFDGKRYSHIVDPRTGLGVTTPRSVTVVARDATTADALASAVSVLGPEEGRDLADRFAEAAVLILQEEDGQLRQYMSPSMRQLLKASPGAAK